MIIEARDLRFQWRPDLPMVLDIPEFSVAPSERLFVRGPSGSGKTTLLGLLGGVLQPTGGSLRVLDQELPRLRGSAKDRFRADHVGFVFQMFNLIPYLDVAENIALPLRFSSRRAAQLKTKEVVTREIKRLMTALRLDHSLYSRQVLDLSVGQQQRVSVARSLIGGPELLIADEPTSALDMEARTSFLELLFQECDRHKTTLIYVSHDPQIEGLFQRTIQLKDINRAARVVAS